MTQGGPLSPYMFNTMVDAIVGECLRQVLGAGAMLTSIREEIRRFLAAFCADDGLVQSRCPVQLQLLLDVVVALFERVAL